MAIFPVISFLVLLAFGSVGSWASCSWTYYPSLSSPTNFKPTYYKSSDCSGTSCTVGNISDCDQLTYSGSGYVAGVRRVNERCGYESLTSQCPAACRNGAYQTCSVIVFNCEFQVCTTKCEADSVSCVKTPGNTWNSASCECAAPPPPPPQDTSYHCQNSGGPEPGGFGGPRVAKLFKCFNNSCVNTNDLAGTCQDWGWCSEGEDDCEIFCYGADCPPCGRSGSGLTSSTKCYYACADGSNLACKPVSTEYVAGAIYVGTCPDNPPQSCRPGVSSSSGSVLSSSSSGSVPYSNFVPSDTVYFDDNGQDHEIDYSSVLNAILDTLHRANVQRDFQVELQTAANNSFDVIGNYAQYSYDKLTNINSKLGSVNDVLGIWANDGVDLSSGLSSDIGDARRLLDEINRYLRSDSLLSGLGGDTVYNPLLRDIKESLDSAVFVPSVDTSIFARDSVFSRWFAQYVQDSAAQSGVIGKIWDDIKSDRDSVRSHDCTGYNQCLAIYKQIDYCSRAWGVSIADCVDGGSPFDNMLNVEGSILSTLWEAIWGEDSTFVDTVSRLDTNVTFSPQKDTAQGWLSRAFSALFSPESTQAILQKVQQMKDSVDRAKRDSVEVQPDSMWLDSAQAAGYVDNMLLPPGTVADCWVCHAELGTLGGLAPDGLSIHVDFGNFGGFDFCAIIRAVVKIAAFVVCMSLTLGSWMAAFGYNPKNDA